MVSNHFCAIVLRNFSDTTLTFVTPPEEDELLCSNNGDEVIKLVTHSGCLEAFDKYNSIFF